MKYPSECPVFEVMDDGPLMRKGAIVEGLGLATKFGLDGSDGPEMTEAIGVRVEDADTFLDAVDDRGPNGQLLRAQYGFWIAAVRPNGLRPLTPAAREMLALVLP